MAEIQKLQKQKEKCLFGFPPDIGDVDIDFTAEGKRDESDQPMDLAGMVCRRLFFILVLLFSVFCFVHFSGPNLENGFGIIDQLDAILSDKGKVDVNEIVFGDSARVADDDVDDPDLQKALKLCV